MGVLEMSEFKPGLTHLDANGFRLSVMWNVPLTVASDRSSVCIPDRRCTDAFGTAVARAEQHPQ